MWVVTRGIIAATGLLEYSIRKWRRTNHAAMAKLSSSVISRMILMMFPGCQAALSKSERRSFNAHRMVAKAGQRVGFVFVNVENRQQFGRSH